MRNLVIDIGNSTKKIAVFDGAQMLNFERTDNLTVEVLQVWISKFNIENSAVCSVNDDPEDLIDYLKRKTRWVAFNQGVTGGIKVKYETPETLGLDRLAKLIAIHSLDGSGNQLVIDMGSCITIDALEQGGTYKGGSISPGIGMRFKALHAFTAKLPLINWNRATAIPEGSNTEKAITRGVLLGVVQEVSGTILEYLKKFELSNIWITGGDAEFLSPQLKNSIFAPQIKEDPYLVLKGLNKVITLETCT